MSAGAIGDPFDQRRAEVGARPIGGPFRGGVNREVIVAVHPERGDPESMRAGGEFRALTPGDALIGRDRPLVIDDIENHRRPVDRGEHQRGMKIGLRGRAVADPARGDLVVARDRRGHRPSDGLRILRAEIAGDRKEARLLHRIEAGKLPPRRRSFSLEKIEHIMSTSGQPAAIRRPCWR